MRGRWLELIVSHPKGVLLEHGLEFMRERVSAYLKDIAGKERGLNRLQDRINEKRVDIEGLKSPRYGDITSKATEDRLSAAYDALDDLKQQWAQLALEFSAALAVAMEVCDVTKDHRWICFEHYVDGWTWDKCAHEIGYTVGHTKNCLVPQGIKEIYYTMPEEWRSWNIPNACPGWSESMV